MVGATGCSDDTGSGGVTSAPIVLGQRKSLSPTYSFSRPWVTRSDLELL
jgi:hypothetical protein